MLDQGEMTQNGGKKKSQTGRSGSKCAISCKVEWKLFSSLLEEVMSPIIVQAGRAMAYAMEDFIETQMRSVIP